MGVLGELAKHLDKIIGPGTMLLYPLYTSMRAIESPSSPKDQQLLTYWVLYSFITLFELSCWKVLAWVPVWPYVKMVFCMWLVLPMFNGAAYIHGNVRKYIRKSQYPESQTKVLEMMSFDARKFVQRYIDTYGPEAFDKVIRAAEEFDKVIRETKKEESKH